MKSCFAKISLLLGLGVGLFVSETQAKMFDISEFRLKNGLQVLVVPNPKAPIVKHMVWYKSGSVDEPRGKSGTAHLLEHLMFRGTSKIKDGVFNDVINQNGGESNAFTSLDYTAYHQFLDISRLELAMYLEADRMQNLKISPQAFEKERNIVFQERKQVVDNNPLSYFGESVRKILWQEHPYGLPVSGYPDDIKSITQEDVEAFYEQYYAPNNAILVLAGDIDVALAQKLAKKYYGKVKARKIGEKADFPKLTRKFEANLQMKLPAAQSRRLMKVFLAPSVNIDADKIYALTVLAKYLGEGETSTLYQDLVLKQKIALDVSVSYDYANRSYGTFVISAVPAKGITQADFEKALMTAMQKALKKITPQKIDLVKQKMLAGLVYLKDNPSDAAYWVGMMASVGFDAKEIDSLDEKIEEVSAKQVLSVAQEILQATSVTGWLLPQKEDN